MLIGFDQPKYVWNAATLAYTGIITIAPKDKQSILRFINDRNDADIIRKCIWLPLLARRHLMAARMESRKGLF